MNLVTGIGTAYMDSVPMVAITANVTLNLLGKDSFQEVDIAGITMPITKHSFIVKDVTQLADCIRKAFMIAKSGRPGPVLVDITKDVTAAVTEFDPKQPDPIVKDEVKRKMKKRRRRFIRRIIILCGLAFGGYYLYTHNEKVKATVNNAAGKVTAKVPCLKKCCCCKKDGCKDDCCKDGSCDCEA